METRSLKYRTIILLQNTTLKDSEIARKFNVSIPWVRMFRDGVIKSPNVDVVQRLYEGLAGVSLFPEDDH
jgi:hypothetical protein